MNVIVNCKYIWGGDICIDRTFNNYKWYISNKDSIIKFIDYIKLYNCKYMKKKTTSLT